MRCIGLNANNKELDKSHRVNHDPVMLHTSESSSRMMKVVAAAALSSVNWKMEAQGDSVEWLNSAIERMWPNLTEAIETMLIESVAPEVQQHLPHWLKGSFSMDKITLAADPPKISNLRFESLIDGFRISFTLDYDSKLDLIASCGIAKFGIFEFGGSADVVVEVSPLVGKIPVAGALNLAFVDPPIWKCKFTGVGRIAELPGIKQAIRAAIDRVLAQEMVLPNSKEVVLLPSAVERPAKAKPQGVMRVTALRGSGLTGADWHLSQKSTSDPYVRVKLADTQWNSSVVKRTCDPEWLCTDTYDFAVYKITQRLTIEVYDADVLTEDDYLGCIRPFTVFEAIGASEKQMELFENARFINGEPARTNGGGKGHLQMRFDWLTISPATFDEQGKFEADGCLVLAEVATLTLLTVQAPAVQVRMKIGDAQVDSPFVYTPEGIILVAASSADKATVRVVRTGAKLGLSLDVISELAGLDYLVVKKILEGGASDGKTSLSAKPVPVSVKVNSSLCLPMNPALLNSEVLEMQVMDTCKTVLAKGSLKLSDVRPKWPKDGEALTFTLIGEDGLSMQVGVEFSLQGLQRSALPPL